MARDNIFAYTGLGTAPEYLSINTNDDGRLEITVRSQGDTAGNCGPTASIKLTVAQELELFFKLNRRQGANPAIGAAIA